ncbi:MAG: hypothetical protein QOJ00_1783 [Actinomycetota bacterium]
MSDVSYDPESHYDRVTDAWGLLLGDELHYGVFATGHESLPEATAALTEAMVQGCAIEPGVRVLDVGCGTGAPACHLASLGATVVGITNSSVGVDAATARAKANGFSDQLSFEIRDGMDNGLPDASFDRVWVLESSHLMRKRDALIAECARVLRRGGRMALCDVITHRVMPFDEVRKRRHELSLLREVFGDAHMMPIEAYTGFAEAQGLVVETATDLTAATRPTFDRWRANANEHRDVVIAKLGEDDRQRFIDACNVLEGLWDEGSFGYGLVAASKP